MFMLSINMGTLRSMDKVMLIFVLEDIVKVTKQKMVFGGIPTGKIHWGVFISVVDGTRTIHVRYPK